MAKGKFVKEEADPISALEGAANELNDLAEEMRSWADNMASANMDHMEKFQTVEQSADTLENADLGNLADTLSTKLNEAVEGEEGHAACPEHVWGVRCESCGWDGNATKLYVVPVEARYVWKTNNPAITDTPMRLTVGKLLLADPNARNRELVKFNAVWAEGQEPPPGAVEAALARMAPRQAKEEARRSSGKPPVGRSFVAPRAALTQLGELLSMKISWTEFRPYGKKSLSRADRFGNAMAAAQAAKDAIAAALEAMKFDDEESPEAELVDELRETFEELESAISELEGGVEFPGMYG